MQKLLQAAPRLTAKVFHIKRRNGQVVKSRPITAYLGPQGRFRHVMRDGEPGIVEEIQEIVDSEWAKLRERCGLGPEVVHGVAKKSKDAVASAD